MLWVEGTVAFFGEHDAWLMQIENFYYSLQCPHTAADFGGNKPITIPLLTHVPFRYQEANATHGPSPVQKMFRDWTEAMLERRGPGPGPGPVLTLMITQVCSVKLKSEPFCV